MMKMLGRGGGRGPSQSGESGGMPEVGRLLPCFLFWFVGGWRRLCLFFAALALAGLEVVGLGGVGSEEGVRGASRSGGSAGVCIVAFAWLRLRSTSLCTVSGWSVGHGSAAGLTSKGWLRW